MSSADSPPHGPSRHPRSALLSAVLCACALTACNIPTDLPILDSSWRVPLEDTRFGVAELLPGDVTLTTDSSAFLVDFDPVTFSESLGALCAACALANGTNIPKPLFLGTFTSAVDFPPEVSSVTVQDGEIVFELYNGFNFDPLRPASNSYGSLTVTIEDDADGDVLGTLTIDGTTTPMAPGATLTRTMTLAGATIDGSLQARVTLDSPLGDPITINAGLEVTVTATPMNIRVTDVTVDVANRSVDLDPVLLDVQDVDQGLADKVQDGSVVIQVTNPFGVSATFQLEISGTGVASIQKSAAIGPEASSTVEIDFTGEEIRSFLGHSDVQLTGSGVVDPAAPPVTVLPGQELILSTALGLTVRLGE